MNLKRKIFILCMIFLLFVPCILTVSAAPAGQAENEIELVTQESEEPDSVTAAESITPAAQSDESETVSEENTESSAEETPAEAVEPPEAPVPENPQGERFFKEAGFYWKPSKNAYYYDVHWQNDRGFEGTVQLLDDDWTCAMDRCIVYAQLPSDGNYTWTVTAVNESGTAESEAMTFSVPSRIPTPKAYRPNAVLDNMHPLIFEWEDVGYNVSVYRIQVTDAATDKICMDVLNSITEMNHVNGVCYLETSDFLPSGSYAWRVQAVSAGSVSNWSEWTAFSVNCPECSMGTYLNTSTAAIFPNGVITVDVPQFTWKAVTGAMNYGLEVKDSREAIILDEKVPASNCNVELCNYVPDLQLMDGESYTWTITTYGWNDSFWGTADGSFSCKAVDIAINDISFIGPESNTSLDPDNQQIIWTDPGTAAAAFRIGIRDVDGEWAFISDLTREAAWCDGITCSIQFYSIPEGDNFEIVVIPYSEYNTQGNAAVLSFSNLPSSETDEAAENAEKAAE